MKYQVKIYTTPYTSGYHWNIRSKEDYHAYSGWANTHWGATWEIKRMIKKLSSSQYEYEYEVEI